MPGEIIITHATLRGIHEHVERARIKHPWPEYMSDEARFRAAERELNEMAAAMLKDDKAGTMREALDCIAVLVRIVEGE